MSVTNEGRCHYCKAVHPVIEATKEQSAAIAEDAQSVEDYYFMADHVDQKTGEQCRGVGRSPESLIGQEEDWTDDGNHLEPGDIIEDWDLVRPEDFEAEERNNRDWD